MADSASTAKPPWAQFAWVSETHVFLEIPAAPGGKPYVLKEPCTPDGFARILTRMRNLHAAVGKPSYTEPQVNYTKRPKGKPDQHDRARAILKRMGVLT